MCYTVGSLCLEGRRECPDALAMFRSIVVLVEEVAVELRRQRETEANKVACWCQAEDGDGFNEMKRGDRKGKEAQYEILELE